MVGQSHVQAQRQDTHSEGHRSGDRLRCIPGGVGCLLLKTENRVCLVPGRILNAYQLPGTTCSNSSNQNLCKVQDHNIYLIEDQQYNSCSLYQQSGRNNLQGIGEACGCDASHITAVYRSTEHNSRHRVQGGQTGN